MASNSSDKTGNKRVRKSPNLLMVIVVLVVVIIVGLIVFNSGKKNNNAQPADNSQSQTETQDTASSSEASLMSKVQIIESTLKTIDGDAHIVGSVKNISNEKFTYFQIEFDLFDKDGVKIGYSNANVKNFEPGTTWDFDATCYNNKVTSFKTIDVTGY